ncbi:hypothetical protein [Spirillospora sp. NBC_01491]|uniref:hypothetical protein n=1 Tax=Spirillospora sp. NBC_01491 TaxID=2976007 RepID=UPI002E37632B|nr:hypothetical protein [Spirillospora sp. NBC_01491]
MPARQDGGALQGGAPRVVWFSSESDPRAVSARSVAADLVKEDRAAHLVWNPGSGEVLQLVPATRAGRLLGDDGAGREGRVCVQIMVVGHARAPFTGTLLAGLDPIMRWLDAWGVARHWLAGPPLPSPQSYHSRRDRRAWARGGHYGASQVPGADRPDPGGIDIRRITGPDTPLAPIPKPSLLTTGEVIGTGSPGSGSPTRPAAQRPDVPRPDVPRRSPQPAYPGKPIWTPEPVRVVEPLRSTTPLRPAAEPALSGHASPQSQPAQPAEPVLATAAPRRTAEPARPSALPLQGGEPARPAELQRAAEPARHTEFHHSAERALAADSLHTGQPPQPAQPAEPMHGPGATGPGRIEPPRRDTPVRAPAPPPPVPSPAASPSPVG